MKLSSLPNAMIAVLVSGLFCACSQGGFSAAVPASSSNQSSQDTGGGSGGGTTPTTPPNSSPELDSLNMKGRISGGSYDQSLAIDLDKKKGEVLVYIPMTGLAGLEITELEVSTAKGIKVGLARTPDGTQALAVRIPAKYILKGISTFPAGRLPNGDALPQIAGGELPTTALTLTRNGEARMHLYLGVETLGIFVETKFDPYIRLTLPIKNEAGTRTLGYFSLIPEKISYRGGFFISVQLPRDISRILDNHFGGL